ncbi:hypothetical protein [Streptomyces sp. NPDC004296]|uniref:hypothetical protein n=1 Tax=Streptomyces sp. NPDC004296 TaxID=3364697 RepID=UPI0036C3E91A
MTTTTAPFLVSPPARAARSLAGGEIDAYLQRFPPRSPGTDWAITRSSRDEVLHRLEQPPFKNGKDSTHSMRMVGARLLLRWLETFEGETWQQRWNTSPGSATSVGWTEAPLAWGIAHGRKPQKAGLGSGLLALVCADVIRPSMAWLASSLSPHLREAIEAARDPRGFAELRNARMPGQPDQRRTSQALKALARILAAKGGAIDDIVAGDVLELLLVATPNSTSHTRLAYALLQSRGQFPPDAPKTLRSIEKRAGQVSPAQLVDRAGSLAQAPSFIRHCLSGQPLPFTWWLDMIVTPRGLPMPDRCLPPSRAEPPNRYWCSDSPFPPTRTDDIHRP